MALMSILQCKIDPMFGKCPILRYFRRAMFRISLVLQGKKGSPSKTQRVYTHLEASKGPNAIHNWTFRVPKWKTPAFDPGRPRKGGDPTGAPKRSFLHISYVGETALCGPGGKTQFLASMGGPVFLPRGPGKGGAPWEPQKGLFAI